MRDNARRLLTILTVILALWLVIGSLVLRLFGTRAPRLRSRD